jgi:hypothetical protein
MEHEAASRLDERGEGDLRKAKAAIERTDQDRAGVRSQRFVPKSTATGLRSWS